MIKYSQKQAGSAHVTIIIILVVAVVGLLGFVFWQKVIQEDTKENTNTSETEDIDKNEAQPQVDTLTYRSDAIGVEFTYPKEWLKVECDNTYVENPQNAVYFGTTSEGLAIIDGKSTQLCGGGSDFPPQMSFKIGDNPSVESIEYENKNAQSVTEIVIDRKVAKKTVSIIGSDSISPYANSEVTAYSIDVGDGRTIRASYLRWPALSADLSGGRDNSEASRSEFMNVVEGSLRFI